MGACCSQPAADLEHASEADIKRLREKATCPVSLDPLLILTEIISAKPSMLQVRTYKEHILLLTVGFRCLLSFRATTMASHTAMFDTIIF